MNASSGIQRVFRETETHLLAAGSNDERLTVLVGYFEASGASLAETLFTRVSAEPFSNTEINTAILDNLDRLLRGIVDTFEARGYERGPYLDRCLEAAERGFLDRGETLFSGESAGGHA